MSRLRLLEVSLAAAGWCLAGAGATAAAPVAAPLRPETVAGPFRIVVERVTQSLSTTQVFPKEAGDRHPGEFQQRRNVQLHLGVYPAAPALQPGAGEGLTRLDIHGVTVREGTRQLELGHYGGRLESGSKEALLRGYLYAPAFPVRTAEIEVIEGEIVAYEHSTPVELELPLTDERHPSGKPERVEKHGVRLTLREVTVSQGTARLTLSVDGPPGSVLITPTEEGTHGASLYDHRAQKVSPGGGSLSQPQPHLLDYRVTFLNLKDRPAMLRVRLLKQHGARQVYPFRLKRIPVPSRRAPVLTPSNEGQCHP